MSSAHNGDYWRDTDDGIRRTTLLDRFAAKVADTARRVVTAIDDNLNDSITRHLSLAGVESHGFAPVLAFPGVDVNPRTYECCRHCLEHWRPADCATKPHEGPCPECQQETSGDIA